MGTQALYESQSQACVRCSPPPFFTEQRAHGHLQLIGLKEQNWKSALMGAATTFCVLALVGPIFLHGGHWTSLEQAFWQNFIVTDDRGPGRKATQAREVVLAGLCVQVGSATLRLLSVQFWCSTGGGAAVFGGLLSRSRGSIDLRRRSFRSVAIDISLSSLVRGCRLLALGFSGLFSRL